VSPAGAEIEVLADPPALADRVADWLVTLARRSRKRFSVALSGGSTPRLLYQELARRQDFPWRRAHWFWGDERFVPAGDPMSNYRMAFHTMLGPACVPPSRIHPFRTQDVTPAESAAEYEKDLLAYYGSAALKPGRPLFDVTLLGLGVDGHTASLFPGSRALDERGCLAVAVTGPNPRRLTLTYSALESSAHVAFLVTGVEKRKILRRLWQGDRELPAARLRPEGKLRFFVDAAAAG
jgi:6-phosphogluconolactonase